MAKPLAFLDTSIFITALLSNRGGAFYILNNFKPLVDFQTNEYVMQEIEDVLHNKFSGNNEMRSQLFLIFGVAGVNIVPNRPKRGVSVLYKYISKKDAPILAGALKESDYLLTLDNEFFSEDIITLASHKNLVITKPKEFIQKIKI